MSTEIEMVFLDIDGTLYEDGHLMDSAVDAIKQLLTNQVPVSLCTGRSVLHTTQIQKQLEISFGIYFNGSLAMHQDEVVHSTPMADDTVQRLADYSVQQQIPAIFHTSEKTFVVNQIPEKYLPILKAFDFPTMYPSTPEALVTSDLAIYQANAFIPTEKDSLLQKEFPECLIYRWNMEAIDLQNRNSDKSLGATALLQHLGILPANALHIGDGGNDIGMFRAMGHSFAMGNATDEVKRHAKHVTDSVHQDGVWNALRKIGFIS